MADNQLNIEVRAKYDELNKLNAELEKVNKTITRQESQLAKLESQGKKNSREYDKLSSSLEKARRDKENLTNSIRKTTAANTKLEAGLKKSNATIGKTIGDIKVMTAALAFASVQMVRFAMSSVEAFAKQELSVTKLRNGLRNLNEEGSLQTLISQANQLQQVTMFADEDIINAQAMLSTFKLTSEEIQILTPRLLDLATSLEQTGQGTADLQSLAMQLGKVAGTELTSALSRMGVVMSDSQKKSLELAEGLDRTKLIAQILDDNFKGLAKTVGKTTAGQIAQLKNNIGDLREAIGQVISRALMPFLKSLNSLVKTILELPPGVKDVVIGVTVLTGALLVLIPAIVATTTAMKTLGITKAGLMVTTTGLIAKIKALSVSLMTTPWGAAAVLVSGLAYSIYDMNRAITINTEELLKNSKVTDSTKEILRELSLVAENTADAYARISAAIAGMSRTQASSTAAFVANEIVKQMAVLSTMRTMEEQRLAAIGDVAQMDIDRRTNMFVNQFATFSGVQANIEKLQQLAKQIKGLSFGVDTGQQGSKGTKNLRADTKELTTEIDALTKKLEEEEARLKLVESQSGATSEAYRKQLALIKRIKDEIAELRAETIPIPQIPDNIVLPNLRKPIDIDPLGYIKSGTYTQRVTEQIERDLKAYQDLLLQIDPIINSVSDSFREFFTDLASGDVDAFKQFMKSIVNAFLTSIQAMIFGAQGAAAAKGITSFGLSLITDLPALAAAWTALEAAKGIIGGLYKGGDAKAGQPYFVGENPDGSLNRTSELFIPSTSGTVLNAKNTQSLLRMLSTPSSSPVNNIYINADVNDMMIFKRGQQKYNARRSYRRLQ